MSNDQMQAAKKELQEAMVILSHINKMECVSRELGSPSIQSDELRLRIEKNLAEISEKLNRLIGPQ